MGERHHHIPESYIKCFFNSKNKVWRKKVNTKYKSKIEEFHSAQIGYVPQFYRSSDSEFSEELTGNPDYVEDVVNTWFENKIDKTFAKFIGNILSLSYSDRLELSEIILHLKRRSLYYRENVFSKENLLGIKEEIISGVLAKIPTTVLEEAFSKGYSMSDLMDISNEHVHTLADSAEFRKQMHIASLVYKTKDHPIVKLGCQNLATSFWEIWNPPLGYEFISSDNPGFLVNKNGPQNLGFSGKFTYYFPLGPYYLLVITSGTFPYNLTVNTKQASISQCMKINSLTTAFAQEFVFSRKKISLSSIK